MAAFLFKCPATGVTATGWINDDARSAAGDAYVLVDCPACGKAHLVNLSTGKAIGWTTFSSDRPREAG